MENDLISRNALKTGLEYHKQPTDQAYETERQWQWAVGYNAGLDRALYTIAYFPAADAAPVVHGRWIKAVTYDFAGSLEGYKCNICGRFCTDNTEPYCHCGAKMDGKDYAK